MNILQWNVRSIISNKPFILSAIDKLSPSIMCFQETNAKEKDNINISGFICAARKDRDQIKGGGVAIFAQKHLATTNLQLNCGDAEAVGISVHLEDIKLNIVSLYFPPKLNNEKVEETLEALLSHLEEPYIICLDANAHHTSWGSPSSDRRGISIADITDKYEATIINTGEPTYLSSSGTFTHIDLTITSPNIAALLDWRPYHDTFHSDHFPITIKLR